MKPTILLLAAFISAPLMLGAADSPALAQTATGELAPADRLAILDIIAQMNQAIDADDYVAYAAFYGEDGVIDSGFGPPVQGRDAIVASLNQSAPFITNKRHVAANIVITGSGTNATAVYYLTVVEREAALTIAGTALITDEFRRDAAGWVVVRHATRMDPATIAAMTAKMQASTR